MAQDSSFDIVSEVNLQVLDDAVNVAMKEIQNRFDFKGMTATIEFKRSDKTLELNAPSEMNRTGAAAIRPVDNRLHSASIFLERFSCFQPSRVHITERDNEAR